MAPKFITRYVPAAALKPDRSLPPSARIGETLRFSGFLWQPLASPMVRGASAFGGSAAKPKPHSRRLRPGGTRRARSGASDCESSLHSMLHHKLASQTEGLRARFSAAAVRTLDCCKCEGVQSFGAEYVGKHEAKQATKRWYMRQAIRNSQKPSSP